MKPKPAEGHTRFNNTPVLPEIQLNSNFSFDGLPGIPDFNPSAGSSPRRLDDQTSPIETCPSEILGHIFSFACTDDGFTGRSLSAVSRHIHEVSKSFKFQSIACRGAAQILAFSSLLRRSNPHPRVVHLFVSYLYSDELPSENTTEDSEHVHVSGFRPLPLMRSRRKHHGDRVTPPVTSVPVDTQVHIAVSGILSMVAPSLLTLSLYLDWELWSLLPMPDHLPVLIELSLNYQFQSNCLHGEGWMPTTCPSLRRFILTGFRRILDPDEIVTRIQSFAPSITHFCVPADAEEILELLHDLRRRKRTTPIHLFPNTLEHLVIHLPGHWRVPYGFKLFGLADQKVALVPRPWDRNRRHDVRQEWEKEWIERTAGGEGYWTMDDRYDIASLY